MRYSHLQHIDMKGYYQFITFRTHNSTDDYYDKAVRDEKQFELIYNYIKNNSLKLGEAKASLPRFYGLYEEKQ